MLGRLEEGAGLGTTVMREAGSGGPAWGQLGYSSSAF